MDNKKIVVASDSFKGTLSSIDICNLYKEKINSNFLVTIPIADGGEGSLDAISKVINGKYVSTEVTGLYFDKINSHFYIDDNNNVYIEAASVVGLTIASIDNDPGKVTTYGLGEQISKAINLGCKNIYIFLGGTASNDGGTGLATALGVKFYNKNNESFIPTGLTLVDITRIDNSEALKKLEGTNIVALTDVSSPFYGVEGAAYKFAPQKGASLDEVIKLDEGLRHLDSFIHVNNVKGAGAAGGLGGGLVGLLNASIKSGINTLLELMHFEDIISNADYVISGEGKLDRQTLDGKVIDGVANYCTKLNKKLIIVVGISELKYEEIAAIYPCIAAIFETNEKHLPFELVKKDAKKDYLNTIDKVLTITK